MCIPFQFHSVQTLEVYKLMNGQNGVNGSSGVHRDWNYWEYTDCFMDFLYKYFDVTEAMKFCVLFVNDSTLNILCVLHLDEKIGGWRPICCNNCW